MHERHGCKCSHAKLLNETRLENEYMNTVKKNVLVTHTAEQMFALVDDIEHYADFLPWCNQSVVHKREANVVEATVGIDYMRLKQSFSTRNTNVDGREIRMQLLEGPFKSLEGIWKFTPFGDIGCRIDFQLQYEFASGLISHIIAPVFGRISGTLVDSFIKEADKRHGK